MIRQYREKPFVVEAVQWDGRNYQEVCDFVELERVPRDDEDRLYIQNAEAGKWAAIGDFIVQDPHRREFDTLTASEFARIYEPTGGSGVDTPEAL